MVRKSQVISEFGEPLTWRKEEIIETEDTYALCRCGHSSAKPFCDGTHARIKFDGSETASIEKTSQRQVVFEGSSKITVKRDTSLCMEAGFCGTRLTNIKKMMPDADDTQIRAQIIAMIERCPSGSYTYQIESDEDIEPDLPRAISVTTEGPYAGALWVTGEIPIERADGQPFETRNRVTLCRCGHSKGKPLCDGTHREIDFSE